MSKQQVGIENQNEKETEKPMMSEQVGESSKATQIGMSTSQDAISPKTTDVPEGEHPLSLVNDERELPPVPAMAQAPQMDEGIGETCSVPVRRNDPGPEPQQSSEQPPPRTSTIDITDAVQLPEFANFFDRENEAMAVRRNLLRNAWGGFTLLTKFRRWILVLRLLIAFAQVAAGITVLAFPSSLGDSVSYPQTCDPEGMFVYLVLHCARVLCSMPIDLYLGLSPHRSPRARRPGAEGLAERERNRRLGSLRLDRKAGRFNDLLGLCHIVLFIVGNYVVWTSFECSHRPADSRPLFFTCVAMLCITYIIVLEIALMVLLVVFFLPLLVACFSMLGITHRLPQRSIHPETGKISQDEIEKNTLLVYYASAERPQEGQGQGNGQDNINNGESGNIETTKQELKTPSSRDPTTNITEALGIGSSLPHEAFDLEQAGDQNSQHANNQRKKWRIGHLIGLSRRQNSSTNLRGQQKNGKSIVQVTSVSESELKSRQRHRYPYYPIPAHRATCPICLCDYEEHLPSDRTSTQKEDDNQQDKENNVQTSTTMLPDQDSPSGTRSDQVSDELQEPELLRLLKCGHVMHKQCVDQWLNTVSGRCPVCQKAVLPSAERENESTEDTAN